MTGRLDIGARNDAAKVEDRLPTFGGKPCRTFDVSTNETTGEQAQSHVETYRSDTARLTNES